MTSKFPSSDHYRVEIANMEEEADSHNHQNDIGGSAADRVCTSTSNTPSRVNTLNNELLLTYLEQKHDHRTPITQSTQVSWSPFTYDFTQGTS